MDGFRVYLGVFNKHIIYQLKRKRDIYQQDFKIVDLHFTKSE